MNAQGEEEDVWQDNGILNSNLTHFIGHNCFLSDNYSANEALSEINKLILSLNHLTSI